MFGDIYNIRNRVKAIDKRFDMHWNGEKYIITQNGMYFDEVKTGEIDDRVVKKIREVVWKNKHTDIATEIDQHNDKVEKSKERDLSNLAESMAKDIRPYVKDI